MAPLRQGKRKMENKSIEIPKKIFYNFFVKKNKWLKKGEENALAR